MIMLKLSDNDARTLYIVLQSAQNYYMGQVSDFRRIAERLRCGESLDGWADGELGAENALSVAVVFDKASADVDDMLKKLDGAIDMSNGVAA